MFLPWCLHCSNALPDAAENVDDSGNNAKPKSLLHIWTCLSFLWIIRGWQTWWWGCMFRVNSVSYASVLVSKWESHLHCSLKHLSCVIMTWTTLYDGGPHSRRGAACGLRMLNTCPSTRIWGLEQKSLQWNEAQRGKRPKNRGRFGARDVCSGK